MSDLTSELTGPARDILALAATSPPTLGSGRLICLDGPAGSGKSTLASAVTALAGELFDVVRMDDLYDGWDGLADGIHQLGTLLRPMAEGHLGTYRRYDWHAGAFVETVTVQPPPMLLLDGVGSGSSTVTDLRTVLVWVDAPTERRRERAIARDGDTFEPHWDRWAEHEAAHFAIDQTRERADVVVDGRAWMAS